MVVCSPGWKLSKKWAYWREDLCCGHLRAAKLTHNGKDRLKYRKYSTEGITRWMWWSRCSYWNKDEPWRCLHHRCRTRRQLLCLRRWGTTRPKTTRRRWDVQNLNISEEVTSKQEKKSYKTCSASKQISSWINQKRLTSCNTRLRPQSRILSEWTPVKVETVLEDEIIKPSYSAYCSPVIIVEKRCRSNLCCMDFWKLILVAEFDSEPVGNI